ncbi:hypothetical protein GGR51DRAFT_505136 [Nemania sp. FL0031]|nr:hypothetical protein GGR51DRAFT_505136 [Nemania sp. FL0031]
MPVHTAYTLRTYYLCVCVVLYTLPTPLQPMPLARLSLSPPSTIIPSRHLMHRSGSSIHSGTRNGQETGPNSP